MTPAGFHPTDRRLSWGRVSRGRQLLAEPRFTDEVAGLLGQARNAKLSALAVGLGRSYGDSGLNLGHAAIGTSRLDRVLAFDPEAGVLRAEAGLSLGEVLRRVVPGGWFLPTTPGTRFVTLGGAVANDAHGKNHHRAGTFGAWVRRMGLLRSDQGEIEISATHFPELFRATIGGLGLTGVILWVEIQLTRIGGSRLDTQAIAFSGCEDFLRLARDSEADFEHVVAWVDCSGGQGRSGRGVLTRGNWRDDGVYAAHDDAVRFRLPADPPAFALNPLTLRLFNSLYYRAQVAGSRHRVLSYAQAFYPLDGVAAWNRLYGRRGFFQFQCVTPMEAGAAPISEMLAAIAAAREGSFLTVLKTFGDRRSPGYLSFPRPGVTLAMDFANRGESTLALLSRLDAIVMAAGGRIYPAKDGRMPPAVFSAGYPDLPRFIDWIDPALSSSFWRRMRHG